MIQTKYGWVSGVETEQCMVYKGIPYAKPPVGELRFKRPVRPEPWEGVWQADHFRSQSVQRGQEAGSFYHKEFYSNPAFSVPSDEDCLYLNIWVPKDAGEEKLPAALYVHGGAFLGGAGSNLPFDGEAMARRGIILVTCNYRLGTLGFMCHPLLTELQGGEPCGNYGLWDQAAALDWVRENIAAFGGDPENITWFGQSAGAMSLQVHCVSPVSEGKYRHMIMQSGGGYENPIRICQSMEDSYAVGEEILAGLGFKDADWENDAAVREAIKQALMTLPAEKLSDAAGPVVMKGFMTGKGVPLIPVIDGDLLPDSVDNRIDAGYFHKIDYILGSNSEDMMAPNTEGKTADDCPMHLANVRFAQKVNADPDTSAYVYYFCRQLPGDDSGAFHSAELWYVFGDLHNCWRPWEAHDYELCTEIMDRWSAMMHRGTTGAQGYPAWPPCTREDGYVEVLR